MLKAVEEICGPSVANKVMARKLEIQAELGSILGSRPKSSGRYRKPIEERRGGTMEQAMRVAIAKGGA